MDLNKAIRDLYRELQKLNQVIASMEHFESTGTLPSPRRRGRKSMSQEERALVSKRMKKYWANRRKKPNSVHG